jgi:hypothetical protein
MSANVRRAPLAHVSRRPPGLRWTVLALLLASVSLPAAQKAQTFTGVITDSMCATANHQSMRMGPTDADCATACVMAHGAMYVLYDGKSAYTLSDQQTPEKFAGKKVSVVGTLDEKTKTIAVQSIRAAK